MNKDAKELFVPGRLCLFGEHSDWAGKYRTMNADIIAGTAIVSGIEQGIYATVEKDSYFTVTSTAPEIMDVWQDFSCHMDAHELKEVAKSGSFFCYCAGVASYMLEWYKVGGVKINITKMTLPIKSGLSSSAAICVLVARAFNLIYNLNLSTMGEMNIAYWGELRTSSRCGRLDQACAFGVHPVQMTFDAEEVEVKNFNIRETLYWVFSDLNGKKDTIKILTDLNKAFPFADGERERNVQYALGELNQKTVREAIKLMEEGQVEELGALMTQAQADFDKYITPMCPSQLTSPKLHAMLADENVKHLTYGGKGVGSHGDGSVQFLAKSKECQQKLVDYLKLKEISYIHSEAYASGELKHGTISLIENGTLVVALGTYAPLFDKAMSNVVEVQARGADVLALTTESHAAEMRKTVENVITVPESHTIFQPSLGVVPLQLFAYYVALLRGCDIDKPRNLAKSVTVE